MEDRLSRLDRALAAAEVDGFLSNSAVDVAYFTGSQDGAATLFYRPGHRPVLLIRQSGVHHAGDTAPLSEVVGYALEEDPAVRLARLVNASGIRRIAWDAFAPEQMAALREQVPELVLHHAPQISPTLRRRKEPEEEELLRQAATIADRAMSAAMAVIRVGVREIDAAAALEAEARVHGCEGSIAPAQCKAGLRSAYADAPASFRRFEPGDLGFIDLGFKFQGYMGDMTRAFVVGDLSPKRRHILETVDQVQQYARSLLKPGVLVRDVFEAARRAFAEAGYEGNPPHHLGHGMGMGGDLPRLVPTSDDVIEEGDWLTVEPGVYVHGLGGVRIEDVVRVTASGVEVISQHPRVTWIPG